MTIQFGKKRLIGLAQALAFVLVCLGVVGIFCGGDRITLHDARVINNSDVNICVNLASTYSPGCDVIKAHSSGNSYYDQGFDQVIKFDDESGKTVLATETIKRSEIGSRFVDGQMVVVYPPLRSNR